MIAIFGGIMIIGQLGLVVANIRVGQWKEAVLAGLFVAANYLIFFVRSGK